MPVLEALSNKAVPMPTSAEICLLCSTECSFKRVIIIIFTNEGCT